MPTKTGIVRTVARNGGIKLEGEEEWYNPAPNVQAAPELKGRMVELELIGERLFSSIRESPQQMDRDEMITRQVAIKTAAEFAKALPGYIDSTQKLLSVADEIEGWINRRAVARPEESAARAATEYRRGTARS